jgi:nucleoid-associated protein YgaU
MIYVDSRYYDGDLRRNVDARSGRAELGVHRVFPELAASVFYYTWVAGDRPDLVSTKVYGDGDLWWRIMDFNPEILDPFVIAPGTVIRIPNG